MDTPLVKPRLLTPDVIMQLALGKLGLTLRSNEPIPYSTSPLTIDPWQPACRPTDVECRWETWEEEYMSQRWNDVARLTVRGMPHGCSEDSSWYFSDTQQKLKFSVAPAIDFGKYEVVLSPYFWGSHEVAADPEAHVRLYHAYLRGLSFDIRTKILRLLPPGSRRMPFSDLGLGGALWVDDLFRQRFDSRRGELRRCADKLNIGFKPDPFRDRLLVPVELQDHILSHWSRKFKRWADTIPGMQAREAARV